MGVAKQTNKQTKTCWRPPRKEGEQDPHPGPVDPRAHCVSLTLTQCVESSGWYKIYFSTTVDLKIKQANKYIIWSLWSKQEHVSEFQARHLT